MMGAFRGLGRPAAWRLLSLLVALLATLGATPGQADQSAVIHVSEPENEAQWAYDPPTLQVPVGQTVTWANNGLELHTVTGDDYAFDSGILDSGQFFQMTFTTPGTYHFRCTIHPIMEGQIMVGEPRPARPYYAQTGFAVGDTDIAGYFQARGGPRTFGYPVSRAFTLRGSRIQIFQRFVLRREADGSVRTLDLPGSEFLPYTSLNGSQVPAADPALIAAAPSANLPEYDTRALAFVAANVPDTLRGESVGFLQAYTGSVTCADAFPTESCNQGLLPSLALEVWGLPTSRA